MIVIDMLDRALLGLNQRRSITDLGEELVWLEVDSPAKARHQMSSRGADQKEGKIRKINKGLSGGMGIKIAPASGFEFLAHGFLGVAAEHYARALKRIAVGAFIQHQRDAGVGEDVFCVDGKSRNQQDWRAIAVTCMVNERAIGV